MANNYVQWRLQTAPSWLLQPYGQSLLTSLGTLEDTVVTAVTQGVEEKYPDYAGLDSAGISTALSYIGNDRALQFVFPDDSNLDATRQYLKSGFSQGPVDGSIAAGCTMPWFPGTAYEAGFRIGQGGYVWQVTTAGTSGSANPFPTGNLVKTQQAGAAVTDNEVVWVLQTQNSAPLLLSSVPSAVSPTNLVVGPPPTFGTSNYAYVPNAPGFYWSGTDTGLVETLSAAGYVDYDSLGNLVVPRLFTNSDWVTVEYGGTTGDYFQFYGAVSETIDIDVDATSTTVSYTPAEDADAPNWASGTPYSIGQFITDPVYDNTYYCIQAGTSGSTNPFPASPVTSSYPIPESAQIDDGGVVWSFTTFAPIPESIPLGGTWGIANFATPGFLGSNGSISVVPNPPDGKAENWSRLWVAVPVGQLSTQLTWGLGTTPNAQGLYPYNGVWGGPPNQYPYSGAINPGYWGVGAQNAAVNIAGQLNAIASNWVGGHVRLIGFWAISHAQVLADSTLACSFPATGNWSMSLGATFGGSNAPFYLVSPLT